MQLRTLLGQRRASAKAREEDRKVIVRLEQHCNYFKEELLKDNAATKGRTLNFISQEMGREINTLGAKAYSSEIQRYVVGMKDELEKIKELLANIA